MDAVELNRAISKAAFTGDTDEYHRLKNLLIDQLVERGSHRPLPSFVIIRNCIAFYLQRVEGDSYYYVTSDRWDVDKFVNLPRPLREIVLSEIRIGSKALREALLLESGKYEEDDLGNVQVSSKLDL